ncbi:hypothetical protein GH714_010968 [Hevea brasiliensis]|uniref:Uncharacterized protein n=1 Tax=Hevea brasiliensis TaxID=3981 RepID=A0A6A6K4B0_HEVBR|nr:hypothetical protein GH714_010968 [Hevea brasiliensis]
MDTDSIEATLPQGFEEKIHGRVVHEGWVQERLILEHPSVDCFIAHCDQIINAGMASRNLKVGVEVEKREDGWFTKESVCKAVKSVIEEDSEVGKEDPSQTMIN